VIFSDWLGRKSHWGERLALPSSDLRNGLEASSVCARPDIFDALRAGRLIPTFAAAIAARRLSTKMTLLRSGRTGQGSRNSFGG
jgi:hypothetical protein